MKPQLDDKKQSLREKVNRIEEAEGYTWTNEIQRSFWVYAKASIYKCKSRSLDTSASSEVLAVLLIGIVLLGLGNHEEGDDSTKDGNTEEDPEDTGVAELGIVGEVGEEERRENGTTLSASSAETVCSSTNTGGEGLGGDDEGGGVGTVDIKKE